MTLGFHGTLSARDEAILQIERRIGQLEAELQQAQGALTVIARAAKGDLGSFPFTREVVGRLAASGLDVDAAREAANSEAAHVTTMDREWLTGAVAYED